jgi:[acyl-carrier-protein] S-malonyltransferase
MKTAALFPGQGSQSIGMGKDLCENFSDARDIFNQADKALGFELSKLCFEGPIEKLTLTEHAQPAILVASYAAFKVAGSVQPTASAGHSLGEYTALVASESIAFEDAVCLVNKRGRYMQEAVQPGAGKMVAVLGPSEEEISDVISKVTAGVAEIANINCPGQIVVAGDVQGVDLFSALMSEQGAKIISLQVSAPFHCRLMKPAAEKLATDLDAITINASKFTVYSNVTASAHTDGDSIRELLKQQVCGSVRWSELMTNMIKEQGVTQSVEFGAGGVLSKLLKRIDNTLARKEVYDAKSVSAL